MDTVARLEVVEAIKAIKARYCRFVDTKQWDALESLFTQDCVFDGDASGIGDIGDRAQFVDQARRGLADCVSVHHCHMPEITLLSDSRATAIWAMEDILRWNDDAAGDIRGLHGFGHYHEAYVHVDGAWKIAAWRLTRLRVDVEPRQPL